MKRIITNGITYLEPLAGGSEWYWGTDYASGDLHEAEELFRSGHPIRRNRLILVRFPEGTVYEPVYAEPGQYLGRPVYHDGQVALLLVDFPKGEIHVLHFHEADGTTEPLAVVPLDLADDCCNLMLVASPLMLVRSGHNNRIQLLWPERRDFAVEENEYFAFLEGSRLYTTVWYEAPDYRDEVLIRDFDTGEILERMQGSLRAMTDGRNWLLV